MKKLISNSSLVLLGVFLAVGLAELLVRFIGLAPEFAVVSRGRYQLSANPLIGYEPIPDLEYNKKSLHFYDYRSDEQNWMGYRSSDYPRERTAGKKRVAIMGDSIAAGLWIEKYSDTFPGKAEALLSKHVPVEVFNFGVVGYNTRQEVATVEEKVVGINPDIVVIAYCLNDIERNDGFLMQALLDIEGNEEKLSRARLNPVLVNSALYRVAVARGLFGDPFQYKQEKEEHYKLMAEDSVKESMARLAELSSEYGFRVLLMVFPEFSNLRDYKFAQNHRELERMSSELGFEYLDLLETMRECSKQGGLAFDQYHPNVLGNQCAAKALAEKLKSMFG